MQQRTPEWLELRRTKIGSSDAPIIMGLSPWKTPKQLYDEKISGEQKKPTAAMQRGIDMEAEALAKFEQLTGISVSPAVIIHPQRDWQMASLDGISFDGTVIAEVKCVGINTFEEVKNNGTPAHYDCQIQHQYATHEQAKEAYCFFFCTENKEVINLPVKKDEELIEKLLVKEFEFWKGLQEQVPPALTDRDFEEIDSLEWSLLAEEYISILKLEERKEQVRKKLIELANGRNCKGSGMYVQKRKRAGNIDYKAVPELFGVDLESYRKKSIEYWEVSSK